MTTELSELVYDCHEHFKSICCGNEDIAINDECSFKKHIGTYNKTYYVKYTSDSELGTYVTKTILLDHSIFDNDETIKNIQQKGIANIRMYGNLKNISSVSFGIKDNWKIDHYYPNTLSDTKIVIMPDFNGPNMILPLLTNSSYEIEVNFTGEIVLSFDLMEITEVIQPKNHKYSTYDKIYTLSHINTPKYTTTLTPGNNKFKLNFDHQVTKIVLFSDKGFNNIDLFNMILKIGHIAEITYKTNSFCPEQPSLFSLNFINENCVEILFKVYLNFSNSHMDETYLILNNNSSDTIDIEFFAEIQRILQFN